MQCVVLSDKEKVELVERDAPEPAEEEALVRLLECGICGSDLHAWHGKWGNSAGLGHEFCGIVEDVGGGGDGLETGMRVAGECFGHCGTCLSCESGHYNHCENICWSPARPEGALAERFCYRAEALFPLPEVLSDDQGAMVEPMAVALHALDRGEVEAGQTVAVIGAGTIGLLCVAIAQDRGASRIFSVAKYDRQADLATELGATDVVRYGQQDPREVIPGALNTHGVDVAIDSVAHGTSFTTALALAHPMGRVVEVGGITRPLMAALEPLVSRELVIRGSSCYGASTGRPDFERAMGLIGDDRVNPERLVTHTFGLGEAQEAFETADNKEIGAVKVVIKA